MTSPAVRLTLTSDPAQIAVARKSVETFAAVHGFSETAVYDLGLCVNEAIANVIRHAYDNASGRPIELAAELDGDRLVVTLRDWGNGRLPAVPEACDLVPPDPDSPATLRPGGLGLPCLKRLLDDLQFDPQPDGMRLRMTKIKR